MPFFGFEGKKNPKAPRINNKISMIKIKYPDGGYGIVLIDKTWRLESGRTSFKKLCKSSFLHEFGKHMPIWV
jgi:hypothetical protein